MRPMNTPLVISADLQISRLENMKNYPSLWNMEGTRDPGYQCFGVLIQLTVAKNRFELVAKKNRGFNREVLELTRGIADVFESPEKINEPTTLNLVRPCYILLMMKFNPVVWESVVMKTFQKNLRKFMDKKFRSFIVALHWMAKFLDPSLTVRVHASDLSYRSVIQTWSTGWLGWLDDGRAGYCNWKKQSSTRKNSSTTAFFSLFRPYSFMLW